MVIARNFEFRSNVTSVTSILITHFSASLDTAVFFNEKTKNGLRSEHLVLHISAQICFLIFNILTNN